MSYGKNMFFGLSLEEDESENEIQFFKALQTTRILFENDLVSTLTSHGVKRDRFP